MCEKKISEKDHRLQRLKKGWNMTEETTTFFIGKVTLTWLDLGRAGGQEELPNH
jgi:hypothetical protein